MFSCRYRSTRPFPGGTGPVTADVTRVNLARWLNKRGSAFGHHRARRLQSRLRSRPSFSATGVRVRRFARRLSRIRDRAMSRRAARSPPRMRSSPTSPASRTASPLHITAGSIGIDAPYVYRFAGSAAAMNLTRLPKEVPITHVESRLAFDQFDVSGQFESPIYIKGTAQFGASEYSRRGGCGGNGWRDRHVGHAGALQRRRRHQRPGHPPLRRRTRRRVDAGPPLGRARGRALPCRRRPAPARR